MDSNAISYLPDDFSASAPLLIEVLLQCFSQGVISAQTIKFFGRFRNEDRLMNVFVGSLVFLSVLQTAQEINKLWKTSVLHLPATATSVGWPDIFLNSLICALCESFLVVRCWKAMNRKLSVLVTLATLGLTTFAASIYLTITVAQVYRSTAFANNNLLRSARRIKAVDVAFTYWTSGSLLLDTILTGIMIVYLIRRRTGLGHLDNALNHFLNVTWESALLPWLSMLIAVILWHVEATSEYGLILFFIIITGKLYLLGLLRSLNSRSQLRQRLCSADMGRQSLGNWTFNHGTSRSGSHGAILPHERPTREGEMTEVAKANRLQSRYASRTSESTGSRSLTSCTHDNAMA
ncbi:hypothetical protein BD410DRAFT_9919 [Rickenella mellea]|uniref:DUF6534 domain-containing protein n=1 Tax=Rickenella mellea TaxID=50990 RepID=A0A4R5XE09_9AGAM|nr:hypothetical protein BD410DRAFT_9919 [Rickenella mellea]